MRNDNKKDVGSSIHISKKLAIIIPGFNCEKDIRRCLKSIINQKVPEVTIFFIDDGSVDNSSNIVTQEFPFVSYIRQENSGVSAARNRGLKEAKDYEYVMFVDADDWLEIGCIETLLANADKADYVFCDWNRYYVKKGKTVSEKCAMNSFDEKISIEDVRRHLLESRNGGSPWAKIFRNDIIQSNKIHYMEALPYAEDYIFNLEYLKYAQSVMYVREPLYAYNCINPGAGMKFRKNRVDITIQIEKRKMELYSLNDPKYAEPMRTEMINQFYVALSKVFNKSFSKNERDREKEKIQRFLRQTGFTMKNIVLTSAEFKAKLVCSILLFGLKKVNRM